MSEQTSNIVSKVWGMCGPLRDDGVSYGDYLEQITYLIFLKMANEYSKPPYKRDSGIPEGFTWADMSDLKGVELEEQYKATLEKLGEQGGILGKIFKGATNKINNAAPTDPRNGEMSAPRTHENYCRPLLWFWRLLPRCTGVYCRQRKLYA